MSFAHSVRASHEPLRALKALKTTVGKGVWTINRSALFVADHKTPGVIVSDATGVLNMSRTETQHWVVFLFPRSCRRLISPACMGSGAAGPAFQKKKKKDLYLM